MTRQLPESDLVALLEDAGGRRRVGPAPLAAVHHGARHRRRRRAAATGLAAAGALAAVVALGLLPTPEPRGHDVPAPAGTTHSTPTATLTSGSDPLTPPAPRRPRASVPILKDRTEAEARERLAQSGLEARIVTRHEPCRPADTVVDHRPGAARPAPADRVVTVVVSDATSGTGDCPQGVASQHDHELVAAVHRWASGQQGTAPWAPVVRVALAETDTRWDLPERTARDRARWPRAPGGGDLLAGLAAPDARYRVDVGAARTCAGTPGYLSDSDSETRYLRVSPAGPLGSCLEWWAVDLEVGAVGQIDAVTVHRGEW